MRGEFFAIIVTLAGSGIVIAFFDWIYRGWLQIEAEEARANALPWGDIVEVPAEAKRRAAKGSPGEGAAEATRRNSHRTSPSPHKEQGA